MYPFALDSLDNKACHLCLRMPEMLGSLLSNGIVMVNLPSEVLTTFSSVAKKYKVQKVALHKFSGTTCLGYYLLTLIPAYTYTFTLAIHKMGITNCNLKL